MSAEKRQCEECKQLLPLTPENFPRVSGTELNYEFVCRPCKKALKQKIKMAQLETDAVEKFLGANVSGGSNIPHTAELLESMMQTFGGTNGFAALCMKQYFDAKPGSRLRNSLLEMVVRLTSKNTEHGGAKKPTSLLTEEELEQEINKRLKNAVDLIEGRRIVDAESIDAGHLYLSDGRVEEPSGGTQRTEGGSLETLQADPAAVEIPQLDGFRDAGDRGES
jgi:hypothetical protein